MIFFVSLQLTPEEENRRRMRRERNKLAASKCRKKRKDHVRNLLQVTESPVRGNSKCCLGGDKLGRCIVFCLFVQICVWQEYSSGADPDPDILKGWGGGGEGGALQINLWKGRFWCIVKGYFKK